MDVIDSYFWNCELQTESASDNKLHIEKIPQTMIDTPSGQNISAENMRYNYLWSQKVWEKAVLARNIYLRLFQVQL